MSEPGGSSQQWPRVGSLAEEARSAGYPHLDEPPAHPDRHGSLAESTVAPPPMVARPPTALVRPRGPRRAKLQLSRIDPWSVLKATLVFSACLLIVFVVAVAVLYLVLDAMGVFSAVQSTVKSALDIHLPLSAPGIIGGALCWDWSMWC